MSHCANPGCVESDVNGNGRTMYLEYMERDGVWVVVCDKHADHSKATIELTDEVKDIPVETLSQIKDDLLEG